MVCRNGYIFVCCTWVLIGYFMGFYCTSALRPSPANIDRASRMKMPTHTPRINPFGSTRAVLPTTSSYSLILSAANNVYGKNADIWPESNNDAIKLSDSFPNGIVPYTATAAIEQAKQESTHESRVEAESRGRDLEDNGKSLTAESGGHTKNYIKRILKRAASKEKRASENKSGSIGKIPIAIALSLLLRGMVRPIDVALVASWTAYFTILKMVAQSERDGGAPVLPTIPPQGHVPMILEHPLGMRFERSSTYRRWLKLGALVGVIGPLAWLLSVMLLPALRGVPGIELETSRVVARPLFLMSCQMITEVITKQNLVPLPIRILVPIAYNASRLVYLWQWVFPSEDLSLGRIGHALGIINAAYCVVNLFCFLLPVASIRYMRAHFFAVEAEAVTTRIGLEETVGIIPNNI